MSDLDPITIEKIEGKGLCLKFKKPVIFQVSRLSLPKGDFLFAEAENFLFPFTFIARERKSLLPGLESYFLYLWTNTMKVDSSKITQGILEWRADLLSVAEEIE